MEMKRLPNFGWMTEEGDFDDNNGEDEKRQTKWI